MGASERRERDVKILPRARLRTTHLHAFTVNRHDAMAHGRKLFPSTVKLLQDVLTCGDIG